MAVLRRALGPLLLFVVLTAAMTWPQVARLGTEATDHPDVYFNMWRFGWIAHAVATNPPRVLDANIFYPEKRTLTFSDAMPVEAVFAVPMLWAGVPPVLVHNLMLLGAIVFSALGIYVLARRLTLSAAAGITAGVIFAFAPYRFEHYMHMELQWTVWIPWAFWALHRTIETGRRRDGALTGLFIALQFLSSIYYGVFLAVLLPVVAALLLSGLRGERLRKSVIALAGGALLAGVLVAPYALEYARTAKATGFRPEEQVLMFSAKPSSYTVATDTNFLYGAWRPSKGRPERRLFPGILPLLLAVVGLLLRRPSRAAVSYLIALALAFEMSLGLYGYSFTFLYEHIPAFGGLRAPARVGVFVLFFLGLLAAWGHAALERIVAGPEGRGRRGRQAALAGVLGAILVAEYWVAPLPLVPYPNKAPQLYTWLAQQPSGVVADLPVVSSTRTLPGEDPRYAYLSTFHWMPSINGYSGYYPPSYLNRIEPLSTFPSGAATRALHRAGVRYVIVHTTSYEGEAVPAVLYALAADDNYTQLGSFADDRGQAVVYQLR
ncbi:MAG: hypothetical protein ABI603_07020 [Acidobacteriota bacterium]